ncbi:MAG: hypothetical protein E7235_00655 [Lachnospiraceae bacterium]|nr:hypothetical protein [Lachnospiraceae bacterium]
MINFKEELLKFEPVLEIENIEKSIYENELVDILDMLNYISGRDKKHKEEVFDKQMRIDR